MSEDIGGGKGGGWTSRVMGIEKQEQAMGLENKQVVRAIWHTNVGEKLAFTTFLF